MKILFISDIHGNEFALSAIFSKVLNYDIDKVFCLGDIGGYFTGIKDVIKILRSNNVVSLIGNHDKTILDSSFINSEKSYYPAIKESQKLINITDYEWLASLPENLSIKLDGKILNLYHGGPNDLMHEYVFPNDISNLKEIMIPGEINLFGHTHLQFVSSIEDTILANPGAVGLPRNGDFRAHGLILDTDTWEFNQIKTIYDIEGFINKYIHDNSICKKYLHNITFGRSSKKNLLEIGVNYFSKEFKLKFKSLKIDFLTNRFGCVFSKFNTNFQNKIVYLAFYEDGSIEMSTNNIHFNWEKNKILTSELLIPDQYMKRDNSGVYYFSEFNDHISLEEKLLDRLMLFLN
tara:strand:+ start:26152 stop:27195 length:1044 start_codon:yes stop_codon:yes gene_type:complete